MFDREKFSVVFLNQSKTPSEFAYKTEDNLAAVLVASYFDELYDIVKVNDKINATVDVAGTPVDRILRVTDNTDKVVTVAEVTLQR